MTNFPVPADPVQIDRVIKRTEELIAEVVKIDPIATTLLGLAKAELVAKKAINDGEIFEFVRKPSLGK